LRQRNAGPGAAVLAVWWFSGSTLRLPIDGRVEDFEADLETLLPEVI